MGLNNINSKTTWGQAASDINTNFSTLDSGLKKVENATTRNKGYFSSSSELISAFPTASKGDIAYVGSSYPYAIWKWSGSAWTNSGSTGGEESVNLGNYHTKEYVDGKLSELGAIKQIKVRGDVTNTTPLSEGDIIVDFGDYDGSLRLTTDTFVTKIIVTKDLLPFRVPVDTVALKGNADADTTITVLSGLKTQPIATRYTRPSKMVHSVIGFDKNFALDVGDYIEVFKKGRVILSVEGVNGEVPYDSVIRIGESEDTAYADATVIKIADIPYELPFDVKRIWVGFDTKPTGNPIKIYTIDGESVDYKFTNNEKRITVVEKECVRNVVSDGYNITINNITNTYSRWSVTSEVGWVAINTGLKLSNQITLGYVSLNVTKFISGEAPTSYDLVIPIYKNTTTTKTVKCTTCFDGGIKLASDDEGRLIILLGGDAYKWQFFDISIPRIVVFTNSENSMSYADYFNGEIVSTIEGYQVFNNVDIIKIASEDYVNSKIESLTQTNSSSVFETIKVPLTMVEDYRYDSNLILTSDTNAKYCEIDVSQYQGCIIKLKAKTRATDATGIITYCGFVDSNEAVIHTFTGRYLTSVMEDDTIILPIPRAFTAYNAITGPTTHPDRTEGSTDRHSFEGAAKLKISSYADFDCSLEIVTKCNDTRLVGKNIAVLGSSNAALYFGGACKQNKGWFLYHLAPLFGYNCSVRNVGGSGWSDIPYQFEECKQDIANTGKDYFDIVYLAEATNDGMGNFLDNYDHYIQGFCKELIYSGSESIDSELNDVCKSACNAIKDIINNSPRARVYIQMGIFNSNDYAEGKGALYLSQELTYENNFLKALCDVFNMKKVSYCNGSSYRVWKEGPWYVWQGQSNCSTSDIKSSQQVLDQGDGIHASKPRGGYDQFKIFFSTLWNDMICDSMFISYPYK